MSLFHLVTHGARLEERRLASLILSSLSVLRFILARYGSKQLVKEKVIV
jgi:hypothetical protein